MCVLQVKYKQAAKQQAASSLFSKLPETLETRRVKEVTELQSEVSRFTFLFTSLSLKRCSVLQSGAVDLNVYVTLVSVSKPEHVACERHESLSASLTQTKYKEEGRREMTSSLYAQLPETSETQFAREMTERQSEVTCSLSLHVLLLVVLSADSSGLRCPVLSRTSIGSVGGSCRASVFTLSSQRPVKPS